MNLLDSKLSAPNADYLSYTLSKQALAGVHRSGRASAGAAGIRVNAIAPGLMLRSSGQSEENFRAMHANNPLRRGVEPEDVIGGHPLFYRRSLRDRADDRDRFRAAFHGAGPRRAISGGQVTEPKLTGLVPENLRVRSTQNHPRIRSRFRPTSDFTISKSARRSGCLSRSRSGFTTPCSPNDDDPAQAWNYDFLRTEVQELAAARQLQPSGDAGACDLRRESRRFAGSDALRVRMSKPDIYPGAEGSGLRLPRSPVRGPTQRIIVTALGSTSSAGGTKSVARPLWQI